VGSFVGGGGGVGGGVAEVGGGVGWGGGVLLGWGGVFVEVGCGVGAVLLWFCWVVGVCGVGVLGGWRIHMGIWCVCGLVPVCRASDREWS